MSDFGDKFIEANSKFRQEFASSGVNEVPATKEFVVNATTTITTEPNSKLSTGPLIESFV